MSPGTAEQASFSIHLENRYASGKIKRPRGPRSSLTLLHPQFDLETKALAYYLQCHLQTTDTLNVTGLSECVCSWKLSGGISPMVDLALCSMALAVYSRTHQHPTAGTEASLRYYRLLRVAQEQIAQVMITQKLDVRSIDACLLAMFLMGRYEGTTHCPSDPNPKPLKSLWSHHDGAMATLKLWNDKLSHNPATAIVRQTRRGLIRSALLRNIPLPDWMLSGDRFGEHGLELEYDRVFVRMVNLHHVAVKLQQGGVLETVNTEELNKEARELDNALQYWATKIPKAFSYRRHTLPEPGSRPKRHFSSSTVYSYSKPQYAAIWGQYFSARLFINNTRLRLLEMSHLEPWVESTFEQQRLECVGQLKVMADNLASTIPFCLERFKLENPKSPSSETSITLNANEDIKPYLATLVVWPLTIASSLHRIDVRQQQWFRSELAGLGRLIGDGALEFAETDQWVIL
ncbi:hypothetical protein B7494_g4977 [Chlorociboria aeruginascens]|nr:hypothetical protein B7494_g4977 [Chlorociboria aeruginascens]